MFDFFFQACTEMGHGSVSNNVTDMFAPSKYNVSHHCEQKWGVTSTARPDWMKTQFWGKSESYYHDIPMYLICCFSDIFQTNFGSVGRSGKK